VVEDGGHGAIPKARLDALTDGVFAFAMTLLVLDVRLPESVRPAGAMELIVALKGLSDQFLAYIISFAVLGLRWLGAVAARRSRETVSWGYGAWVLVHLFFITCIPFSTWVVGRYNEFAPATWLYAANMIGSGLASLRVSLLDEQAGEARNPRRRRPAILLVLSALLSVALSFVAPSYATLAYLLNALPLLQRLGRHQPS
jgi:uncharacterized membrane protein